MKNLICLTLLFVTLCTRAESVKLWDGKTRGMDLVTVGYKRVTVFLADGRTTVLGIPILVEKPKKAAPAASKKPAMPKP